jgi:hypothetical protein
MAEIGVTHGESRKGRVIERYDCRHPRRQVINVRNDLFNGKVET